MKREIRLEERITGKLINFTLHIYSYKMVVFKTLTKYNYAYKFLLC